MENLEKYGVLEYYKIMIISLVPDGCRLLKGPHDEKKLVEFLEDDYHIGRYEKMLQLVVREKIEESAQERVSHFLSLQYLKKQFESKETRVACSYQREIAGKMREVSATAYPRKFGEQGELEEFMVYIRLSISK